MAHAPARTKPHIRRLGLWLLAGSLALVAALVLLGGAVLLAAPDLPPAGEAVAGLWSELPPIRDRALTEQADAAFARGEWPAAVAALSALCQAHPDDARLAARLGIAHFLAGQAAVQAGNLDAARAELDAAAGLTPDQPAVVRARTLVRDYLEGQRRYAAGDWSEAIRRLEVARSLDPGFRDVTRLLYHAHYQQGVHLQARAEVLAAQAEYRTAQSLWPGGPEARAGLAAIERILNPPPKKRIVISISKQRMRVYENERVLHDWVCSTGEPGRDTHPGSYQILSKMKSAYASVWDLDMPYWMGIYYAGASENGIHAPPIQRATGRKMWEGLLGSRVSFGCVILSEANARELYGWAEVGTPVEVVR